MVIFRYIVCDCTLQMYVLLFEWERLSPEKAMELLDYHYADVAVRNYAVDCLEQLEYVIKAVNLVMMFVVFKCKVTGVYPSIYCS